MQNFDEIQECPHCRTNKELKADLQFLFSECCGYALCESCTSQIFSKNATLKCPNCNEAVNKKKYSKNRLSTQQFHNEATKRTQIHQFCNLRIDDFNCSKEWNDYLEFVEDLVYDLSHGSGDQRKKAEQTFKDWKIKNRQKIDKNKDKEFEENMNIHINNNHNNKNEKVSKNNTNINVNEAQQNVTIHPVFSHYPAAICIDRTDSPNIPSKISMEKLKKRRQKTAGFTNKLATIRDKTELLSGLFFFHPPMNQINGTPK